MVEILRRAVPRDLDADRKPFDVNEIKLEEELGELVRQPRPRLAGDTTLQPVRSPLDVSELGRLSGDAVVKQYEVAMNSLQALGKELIECVQDAETMVVGAKDTIKYIEDTIQRYRSEAQATKDRIEHASLMTANVRKLCDDMRTQIGAAVPTTQLRKVDAAAGKT